MNCLRRFDRSRFGCPVPLLTVTRRPVTVRWGEASASRFSYGITLSASSEARVASSGGGGRAVGYLEFE
jgi:hypothetical protein